MSGGSPEAKWWRTNRYFLNPRKYSFRQTSLSAIYAQLDSQIDVQPPEMGEDQNVGIPIDIITEEEMVVAC
jgi:hypothetical protein